MQRIRVAFFGDVVGRPGRRGLASFLPQFRQERGLSCVIANGENAAGGLGLDAKSVNDLTAGSVDIITSGDHVWKFPDIHPLLNSEMPRCIRPANYPPTSPGRGWTIFKTPTGESIGVINVIGRVFIDVKADCPYRMVDSILEGPLKGVKIVVVDFHAEASSEKMMMGRHLDGRASLVVGTHVHIQTADEQILPGGTAYLSDAGMCGPLGGVIGMYTEVARTRLVDGMPRGYAVAEGVVGIRGVVVELDAATGRALTIERVRKDLAPV